MKFETKFKIALCGIIFLMSTIAAIPVIVNRQITSVMSQLRSAALVERSQLLLLEMLLNAETGQRGFVVTGNEHFLEPYYTAVNGIPALQDTLRKELRDPEELIRNKLIEKGTAAKIASVVYVIELRRNEGFSPAARFISTGTGKAQMDALRQMIGKELDIYSERRMKLSNKLLDTSNLAAEASLIATLTNVLFLGGILVAASRVLRQRDDAERRATAAASDAHVTNQRISTQNELLYRSAELMHALELAESVDESASIIASYLPGLLPELTGSLYLYNNSRDLLERKAAWGDFKDEPDMIDAIDCWALRRGSSHLFNHDGRTLACRHVVNKNVDVLCLPLVTQGDVIGCLTLAGETLANGAKEQSVWIDQLSEQLGLALSNVRLRVSLRQQSIIDPLTQLYNRRYMDEVLKRELARSNRNGAALSVLILDLDHFKRINDTFGHDAGDAILRKVGLTLLENIRSCDLACRLGGEEMVIVLSDCDIKDAVVRAEAIRQSIADADVLHGGQRIGATSSIGVATYPDHANSIETLMHAADRALYEAKGMGRNRVEMAKMIN